MNSSKSTYTIRYKLKLIEDYYSIYKQNAFMTSRETKATIDDWIIKNPLESQLRIFLNQ